MPRLARAELAEIPPPHRHTFACLNVALEIAQAEKNWEEARRAAETLATRFPPRPSTGAPGPSPRGAPPGSTRLALILATRAAADFPDEVIHLRVQPGLLRGGRRGNPRRRGHFS